MGFKICLLLGNKCSVSSLVSLRLGLDVIVDLRVELVEGGSGGITINCGTIGRFLGSESGGKVQDSVDSLGRDSGGKHFSLGFFGWKIHALSVLAVAVYLAPPGWPTAEEAKSEMLAAGISSQAIDGILNLASTFASQKPADGSLIDRDAARTAFNQFISQVDDYIKTQSPADQTAYTAFVAKKKADFETRVTNRQA